MTTKDGKIVEGGQEAHFKVLAFLEDIKKSPDTEGDFVVQLVQLSKSGEMNVAEFEYDYQEPLDKFVDEIIEEATEDAFNYGGKTKYAVRVEGKKKRCGFALVVPEMGDDEEDSDIEDFDDLPNRKGIMTQQMRHNEVFLKQMLSTHKREAESLRQVIKEQAAELKQHRANWFEQQKVTSELMDMSFARRMEIAKLESSEKRKDKVADVLMQAGPMVVSKLLGGGQQAAVEMMGARSPMEQMLEALFKSLQPEQLQKLSEVLDPMQLATLGEMHRFFLERQEKEEELRQQQQSKQPSQQNSNMHPYSNGTNGTNGVSFTHSPVSGIEPQQP